MTIEWSDRLATGDPVLDAHHRSFILKARQLLLAVRAGTAADELAAMLDFMADYTEEHFAFEEERMRETEFPGLQEHIEQHQLFRTHIEQLRCEFGSESGADFVAHAAQTMVDWAIHHISNSDIPLVRFLQAGGQELA